METIRKTHFIAHGLYTLIVTNKALGTVVLFCNIQGRKGKG